MRTEMPIVLSIAGSDSGGGAGIQADLKTFAALGVHGCTAVTAITVQDTKQVHRVLCLEPDLVGDQIVTIRGDFPVAATKLGMLGNVGIIGRVSDEVALGGLGMVVLDPVMVAASGAPLLEAGAVEILREALLPKVDLLTPNLPEAAMLLDRIIADEDAAVEDAARDLLSLGASAVLLKAGHRQGKAADDLLMLPEGPHWLRADRLKDAGAHGTGCSLSAAIAALLAREKDLKTACAKGKEFVRRGMEEGLRPGRGEGILHHFWEYYGREGLP